MGRDFKLNSSQDDSSPTVIVPLAFLRVEGIQSSLAVVHKVVEDEVKHGSRIQVYLANLQPLPVPFKGPLG